MRPLDKRFTYTAAQDQEIDQGLRSYMLKVYNYMGLGLGLTGSVAFLVLSSPALFSVLVGSPLLWLFMFAPLGIVFYLSFAAHRISASTAQLLFWVYAGLMGVSLASICVLFTGESIARVFFITACTFGAMSLYGYTTQRDLSAFGSFLFMGLIGIILSSLVNLFLQSSGFQFVISIITVLVFTGLTAYDTQLIRDTYAEGMSDEIQGKTAVMGALRLYLDFINIFITLLQLFGDRK